MYIVQYRADLASDIFCVVISLRDIVYNEMQVAASLKIFLLPVREMRRQG